MNTVTIPKEKYELLKRRAGAYEAVLRFLPRKGFGIEDYSPARIEEFREQDAIGAQTKMRVQRFLNSL